MMISPKNGRPPRRPAVTQSIDEASYEASAAEAASSYEEAVTTFGFDSGEAMAAWLYLRAQPGRFRPLTNWRWLKR